MAKIETKTAPVSTDTAELLAIVKGLKEQLDELRTVDEEEPSPANANTNNAQAQILVSQVGDVVQAPGFVTPIPERVFIKGPKAVKKFLDAWKRGQSVSARQIGDEAALADTATM
jgi:hypothetical protein|tara:strand:+ start:2850 stop:3194 length:345 start_codon:yes stop_codon:yes gene_type:complete